jgi:hypothetical protein
LLRHESISDPQTPSLETLSAQSLELHGAIWQARQYIGVLVSWAWWVSLWLISLGALALAYFFFPTVYWISLVGYLDLTGWGVIFVGLAPRALLSSRKANRLVRAWEETILPFVYTVTFELLPYSGPDREHDIWDRYKSIYQDLSKAESKGVIEVVARVLGFSGVEFNAKIRFLSKRHAFNIASSIGFTRRLFVRRLEQSAPVTRIQLREFKEEIEDGIKFIDKQWDNIIGVFSPAGFEQDAVDYAQSEAGLVYGDFSMDLVQETETGYRVVQVRSV